MDSNVPECEGVVRWGEMTFTLHSILWLGVLPGVTVGELYYFLLTKD
jgi:hypothetical protein